MGGFPQREADLATINSIKSMTIVNKEAGG